MNYPQQPSFPPNQGPQWQGGGYYPPQPPGYGPPAPPPKKNNTAGVVLLVLGGVVIVVLIVAIFVVVFRGVGGSDVVAGDPSPIEVSETPETTSPAETTPEETPEETPYEGGSGVFPEAMDGTWSGTMTQYDPDGSEVSTWELEVDMEAGESSGTAELEMGDGATCTWEIVATDSTEDTVDISYLTTDDGDGTCTASGFVHFIADDDRLFTGVSTEWDDGQVSTADGVLE